MKKIIIAIDGEASSGKSTLAKVLAKKMCYKHINTGSMYRGIALKCIDNKVYLEDAIGLKDILNSTTFCFGGADKKTLLMDDKSITESISSTIVTDIVSDISSIDIVREKLVEFQRKMVKGKNVVMEGRDIGTVVLPEAEVKIFLIASLEERAKRRLAERKDQTYLDIIESMKNRDNIDSTRKIAPLKAPKNSLIIDTEGLNIIEVSNKIIKETDNEYSI